MRSYTFLELTVAVLIIGVLASLAFINYQNVREDALDREAQANLRLIVAAERIYRIENSVYFGTAGGQPAQITQLNTNLKLRLSDAGSRRWDYRATAGGASPTCAESTRVNGPNGRTWRLRSPNTAPEALNCP